MNHKVVLRLMNKLGIHSRANYWDNAPMEGFFGHLKEEYLRQFPNPTLQEAQQLIYEYIHFYNYQRIQLKTKQTPFQLRCLSL
jgi:putative transposase